MVNRPYLSVVLPTRDRLDQLMSAIEAILSGTFADIEIVVVDQSENELASAVLNRMAAEQPTIRVVLDPTVGSSHARNVGIGVTRGEVIAFTDDDCEASPDWLAEVAHAFRADPELGALCGTVSLGSHDTEAGFIVGYQPRTRMKLRGRLSKLRDAGMGANMAYRRSVLDSVGGWDELLGAGSLFPGSGDGDLLYRVLAAGYPVLQLPQAGVVHHGFRDWDSGGPLIRGRYRGVGAAYAKHLRMGDPVAAVLLAKEVWLACENIAQSIWRGKHRLGFGRLIALTGGIFDSFRYPIDRSTRLYRPLAATQISQPRGERASAPTTTTSSSSSSVLPDHRMG